MPPIRKKDSKDLIEQEGRILLAISDFQNGKIPKIAQAARIYNIPRTTLRNRLHGIEQRMLVQAAISEYGILPEDIYNFDETGFAMGLCATAKVITGSDRYARPKLLQPGNREWVTAIEATNSTGWALPSFAATGLVPFNPDRVIQQLNIQLKTPTPPSKLIKQFTIILLTNTSKYTSIYTPVNYNNEAYK
ncbi:conserved hypothetical protein [Talaromyces stipitatus ATCC 10500]|uniref:HTH psq-type domain-containing protein n=1 Tax=Talaromyces stipitatus (strain ATCC 10500 / CBS 375.48 / QM 6759 / NRRL 1006) TaxID=441959 RepID=B8LVA3_TALSN|nr:uncharacterized protein TSTA_066060 [Talaromyces stipitatus ATCC 10500]EED23153.1 conserved hypothetical protein [Talaromyces stipitatus ATCC 10500]